MSSRVYSVTIDAHDPRALAEFWCRVLDYRVALEDEGEVAIEPPDGAPGPDLVFVPVSDEKAGKNRVHLDLVPDDHDAEVERLLGLGAQRVDIGQRNVTWEVLADIEGNEFCVLSPRRS